MPNSGELSNLRIAMPDGSGSTKLILDFDADDETGNLRASRGIPSTARTTSSTT